jgi:pyridinium-3,5-bisthiocarboxylic acid mononucleotide nickel chelatase
MRIAVFDPFCGISGNMILGAFVDSGLDVSELVSMLHGLKLTGWKLDAEDVLKNGLKGCLVTVSCGSNDRARVLPEISGMISDSSLPEPVVEKSIKTFETLAGAESRVHGVEIDQVHFHETGAVDAIIDIVGSFCCLHLLSVERVYSSPVATGTGTVDCEHGTIPVPAPATVELLMNVPTVPTGLSSELTTPTGAAILTTSVHSWTETVPVMTPTEVGYGAGTADLSRPNLLRVTIGDSPGTGSWNSDRCIQLSSIVDDMDPRLWPDLERKLLENGAIDCYVCPVLGRKGRPAMEVTVICDGAKSHDVIESIFINSTTLGVRIAELERAVLDRDFISVDTSYGEISVKRAFMNGRLLELRPEYDDCARAAGKHDVPVREVIEAALMVARTVEVR